MLVVDDDPDIRELLFTALEDEGFEVVPAGNGQEALAIIKTFRPDVIVLDLMMPVMDGWTFAHAYHERPGPHAPIVVLTAARDAEARAVQIRADGYLGKPFDMDDLLRLVAHHTGRA